MSFTWNANAPGPNDGFSVSQGLLQTDLNTLDSVLNVDHVPPSNGGPTQGQHKQITLPAVASPGASSGFSSTLYSQAGTALTGASQLFWKNSQAVFHQSALRAWCTFNGVLGVGPLTQSSNVSSITRTAAGIYDVILATGAVSSSSFGVLISTSTAAGGQYLIPNISNVAYGASGTFTIKILRVDNTTLTDSPIITFSVLQI